MISSKFVVFSYDKNQQGFVLKIYDYLKRENLPVWIDIHDQIDKDIYRSEDDINKNISILVCFLTPMYQSSKHCQEQIKLVKNEGIPVIGISFLPNWKPSGWLNKILNDLFMIDLQGINQKNFENKINKLREKIIWLLENTKNLQRIKKSSAKEDLLDRSIFFDDSNIFSINFDCSKKKQPLKYRLLPPNCRFNLSNLLICNNEYILIHGNNYFHLFDKNLKLIRSNNEIKINENDLKDLNWCSDLNYFLILTKKNLYLMNPLTSKISLMKLKHQYEEFLTCSCSSEKFFLITYLNSFYLEEYSLSSFRFIRKCSIIDLMGIDFSIQNGFSNQNSIQEIISMKYYQNKLAIIMKISFQWFIYVFHLYEQPICLMKIPLEGKCRMTILYPIHQWIIFKDYLSNSFIQISINSKNGYSKGFIDFNGKLRSIALFGTSNIVILIDDALAIYQL